MPRGWPPGKPCRVSKSCWPRRGRHERPRSSGWCESFFSTTWMRRRGDSRQSWPRSRRSEEHTSELQSPLNISYAVFCLKKKKINKEKIIIILINKKKNIKHNNKYI